MAICVMPQFKSVGTLLCALSVSCLSVQDFYWVSKLVKTLVLSMTCVLVSTCVVHWLILDYSFM